MATSNSAPIYTSLTDVTKESAARADNLETEGDRDGAAIWRRITDAVEQLANPTPSGPVH